MPAPMDSTGDARKRGAKEADLRNDDPRPDRDLEEEMWMQVRELHDAYILAVKVIGQEQLVCEDGSPDGDCGAESAYGFVDDVSGKLLKIEGVERARREEMEIIRAMGYGEVVDRPPRGARIIGTRRVDINKGDEERLNNRSRLVAKELKETMVGDFLRPCRH